MPSQFAFNDHDCRTPAALPGGGLHVQALQWRVLWRLPSPSPNFFLLTTRLDDALVDLLHETIPRAVSRLTGVQFTGSIEEGTQDRRSQSGWVAAGGDLQPESRACRDVVGEFCGWSYIEVGCIVLNTAATPGLLPACTRSAMPLDGQPVPHATALIRRSSGATAPLPIPSLEAPVTDITLREFGPSERVPAAG